MPKGYSILDPGGGRNGKNMKNMGGGVRDKNWSFKQATLTSRELIQFSHFFVSLGNHLFALIKAQHIDA